MVKNIDTFDRIVLQHDNPPNPCNISLKSTYISGKFYGNLIINTLIRNNNMCYKMSIADQMHSFLDQTLQSSRDFLFQSQTFKMESHLDPTGYKNDKVEITLFHNNGQKKLSRTVRKSVFLDMLLRDLKQENLSHSNMAKEISKNYFNLHTYAPQKLTNDLLDIFKKLPETKNLLDVFNRAELLSNEKFNKEGVHNAIAKLFDLYKTKPVLQKLDFDYTFQQINRQFYHNNHYIGIKVIANEVGNLILFHGVNPYDDYANRSIAFLQQLDMPTKLQLLDKLYKASTYQIETDKRFSSEKLSIFNKQYLDLLESLNASALTPKRPFHRLYQSIHFNDVRHKGFININFSSHINPVVIKQDDFLIVTVDNKNAPKNKDTISYSYKLLIDNKLSDVELKAYQKDAVLDFFHNILVPTITESNAKYSKESSVGFKKQYAPKLNMGILIHRQELGISLTR